VVWVAAAAALAAAAFLPLPYYSVGPGPVREVTPLITYEGMERYEPSGRIVLTTVRLYRASPLQAVRTWLDADRVLVPDEEVYPEGTTEEREQERAISQMDQSKIDATYVVLRELTAYPRDHGEGALIESTLEECPADGVLYPGDVVLEIGGEPVGSRKEASRLIDAAAPGERLRFLVEVDGQTEEVSFIKERCAEDEDRELVGVRLLSSFPLEVAIASDEVGGSSAGLMWAIGLYDLMTPEDLTEGRLVAGTGTIAINGDVYPIGGIRDKVVAAREAGAAIFFLPEENLAELGDVDTGQMQLVPVSTFDEALEALRAGTRA
jgi:PDZ domain-containing protein